MPRLTVSNIKNSSIPRTLGVCPDDERLLQWLNEAEERMLNQGRWWGSVRLLNLCVTNGCLVMPREVANIEQTAFNGQPIPIYTSWYAFTQNLARVETCNGCNAASNLSGNCGSSLYAGCGHVQMRDQGEAVSFAVTRGSNKKIRAYPSSLADVGKKIIIQGYDHNKIWVRTSFDGSEQDGEQLTLTMPYAETSTIWSEGAPTGIIKDQTEQVVRLYSYNVDNSSEKLLATYQPTETRPTYRRYQIPLYHAIPKCYCCRNEDGEIVSTVNTIAKMAHVTLQSDNDWLVLENLSAYKAAMQAVKAYEENDLNAGNFHFFGTQAAPANVRNSRRVINRNGAIPLLNAELQTMTGGRTDAYWHAEFDNSLPCLLRGFR